MTNEKEGLRKIAIRLRDRIDQFVLKRYGKSAVWYKNYDKDAIMVAFRHSEQDEITIPYDEIEILVNKEGSSRDKVEKVKEELKQGIFKFRSALVISSLEENSAVAAFAKLAQNLLNALDEQEKADETEYLKSSPKTYETINHSLKSKDGTKYRNLEEFDKKYEICKHEFDDCEGCDFEKEASSKANKINTSKNVTDTNVGNIKSIWKDVSELPKFNKEVGFPDVVIKFNDGNIRRGILQYDFLLAQNRSMFNQKNISQYCLLKDFVNSFEDLQERVRKLETK